MKKSVESCYPYVLGGVSGIVWHWAGLQFPASNSQAILSGSLTLGSITTGFMAAAMAILISLRGSSVMDFLQRTKYFDDLIAYMSASIWFPLILSVYSIAGLIIGAVPGIYQAFWAGLLVATLLCLVRILLILIKILAVKEV